LGCGGFVISNFQEEIAEYFVPGQDLEIYENLEDLFAKTKFYLEHDDARRQIAQNGFEKVQRDFTFQDRLSRMISGATL
jgi:spore maturation protein CgeB